MTSPWLNIPADEYEGHMSSPAVGQLQILSELFAESIAELQPKSVAIFGCATGNGLEHIDSAMTERIVGVDINPAYLKILWDRHSRRLPNLELSEQDCASQSFSISPVMMVFAALLFEYVPIHQAINNITKSLLPGGMLVAALQTSSANSKPVTKTTYSSLELLSPIIRLVEPTKFTHICCAYGLKMHKEQMIRMKQGKAIFVGYYEKEPNNLRQGTQTRYAT